MKRFASNYMLLPDVGYFRQQVIVIADDGSVVKIDPLVEESESIEWMPGVIVLMPSHKKRDVKTSLFNISDFTFDSPVYNTQPCEYFDILLKKYSDKELGLIPYLLFPFDFTSMQPVAETQHRQLP